MSKETPDPTDRFDFVADQMRVVMIGTQDEVPVISNYPIEVLRNELNNLRPRLIGLNESIQSREQLLESAKRSRNSVQERITALETVLRDVARVNKSYQVRPRKVN